MDRVEAEASIAELQRRQLGLVTRGRAAMPCSPGTRLRVCMACHCPHREVRSSTCWCERAVSTRGPASSSTGRGGLRALVDELSPLDAQCDSVLETDYLRMARQFGIEPTAMNHPVRDSDGRRRRLDAVYLPEHVWVELDSRKYHSCILDRNDDQDREGAVAAVGLWGRPLRFSWGDIHDRPAAVAAAVRAALAASRRSAS